MSSLVIGTPLGKLRIEEDNGAICRTCFIEADEPDDCEETQLLLEAKRQVCAYFDGRLRVFDLPLNAQGTPFQIKVWRALTAIPYGRTVTYGQIAEQIGKPTAVRAVGAACGRNPLLLIFPCHRVLGADGKLTGFAAGIERKRALLELEHTNCR